MLEDAYSGYTADFSIPVTLNRGCTCIHFDVSDADDNDHWIIEPKTNPKVNIMYIHIMALYSVDLY